MKSKVIVIFNLGTSSEKVTVHLTDLGLRDKYIIRDTWLQKEILSFEGIYKTNFSDHGVVLLKLSK